MKFAPLALAVVIATAVGFSLARQPQERPAGRPPEGFNMGQRIVEGLRNTPGCLGVDSADTQSGRNVIFAWFENKAAAMEWYNSETHTRMRKSLVDLGIHNEGQPYQPMAHIPDNVPILTIASMKFARGDDARRLPGVRIPLSEIAIEMYAPLPGGIRYAGGFTPESVPIPNRLNLDAEGNLLHPTADLKPEKP